MHPSLRGRQDIDHRARGRDDHGQAPGLAKMFSKPERRRRTVIAALFAMIAFTVLICWVAVTGGGPGIYTATVTVDTTGATFGAIGGRYVGLSFESSTLNSGKFDNTGNLAQLLRTLGTGVIRLGGNSVDRSFAGITPSGLEGLARLVDATGWQVLYSENMGSYHAASVTADAKAVEAALGGRLRAFACGNEPEDYSHHGLRARSYNVADYLGQVATCIQAIRAGVPNAQLEGPDSASPRWVEAYARQEAGTISWLGQHYYPLGCAAPGENPDTVASALLSPALAAKEATTFRVAVTAAKAARAQLVISETNSACCGGVPGLSDTYASALWIIDYMLTGAENDVHSMNVHGGLDSYCKGYTVLCQVGTGDAYNAQPIYYGMLLTHLLGTGRFLPVRVAESPPAGNMAAFAVRPTDGGGVRLIVENLSNNQADTTLHVSNASGSATVLTLTGPSLLATSGVQIQDASVAANGTFQPGEPNTIRCRSHTCPLTLTPYTAALVTFPTADFSLRPG